MKSKQKEDLSQPSWVIRLQGLDKDRSRRMYETLSSLSTDAVEALKNKNMKLFSVFTDKMRPLLSYIATNSITLSEHINKEPEQNLPQKEKKDSGLGRKIIELRHNLKIIEDALKAGASIPFGPKFFSSEELTNAVLDYLLPLAWDFEYDAVILINLTDTRLLDYLVTRGQKRIFLIGGSIKEETLKRKLSDTGVTYWFHNDPNVIKELIRTIANRPPLKIISIDCGEVKLDAETAKKMEFEVQLGRTACWQRFNTINRADSQGILDNLYNLTFCNQTSEFHKRFDGIPAVIVSPGPSLSKNIRTLKKVKGKALIICVLHALSYMQKEQIEPDIVIQVDPIDLKSIDTTEQGLDSNLWEEWINKNDLSKVNYFITSAYAGNDLFKIPAKNIMWMNAGLPLKEYIPLDIEDYNRVGGSVSHSAFDVAVEFGCSSIALVGQDLAYGEGGLPYAAGGLERKKDDKVVREGYGTDLEVPGYFGKTVQTSEVLFGFANHFSAFTKQLKKEKSKLKFFNCTEGGMYIDGFEHCSLEDFLKEECEENIEKKISSIFSSPASNQSEIKARNKKMVNFIERNFSLAKEISSLIGKVNILLRKGNKSEKDLERFNNIQNKIIKLMGKNYFYSLSLQKYIHILQAGLKADASVEGQLGFHKDFLNAVEEVNLSFQKSFLKQKKLFKSHKNTIYS